MYGTALLMTNGYETRPPYVLICLLLILSSTLYLCCRENSERRIPLKIFWEQDLVLVYKLINHHQDMIHHLLPVIVVSINTEKSIIWCSNVFYLKHVV